MVFRILLINPNSSTEMTESLRPLTQAYPTDTDIALYTAPSGAPRSINGEADATVSAKVTFPEIFKYIQEKSYDGYLVACFSLHPLVEMIRAVVPRGVYVTGIFEASITTALALTPSTSPTLELVTSVAPPPLTQFGIITTGKAWVEPLSRGVMRVIGVGDDMAAKTRFKGVESTGLTAEELHTHPVNEVNGKMKEAAKRLIKDRDIKIIILGCAGMSGAEELISEALSEELGPQEARSIYVLDGVKGGLGMLENMFRSLPAKDTQ